jgi:hypothetical protein
MTHYISAFGTIGSRSSTSAVTLTVCAVAVAGAIGMILELEQGFGRIGPYLSPANARSRQDIANRTRSRGLRIRPDLSTRRSLPITRGTARSRRHCRPSRGAGSSHPFFPHALQRACWRSRSLCTSAPHRMTATAQASGAWCWQRSHQSHTQGVAPCSSPRVGIGPGCMRANWPIQKTFPKLPPKTFENQWRIFSCRPAPDRRAPGRRRRAVSRISGAKGRDGRPGLAQMLKDASRRNRHHELGNRQAWAVAY